MATVKFSVKAKSESPTKTVVDARGFKIIVDKPENLGGTNHGASPVEYVLAALSGCLNVVSHIVAKEMGFKLNGLEIDLEGDLDPAKFSGMKTTERAGYKQIRVALRPDTDADADTLDKWRNVIEQRCPVSDNLVNPTPVLISVVK